MRNKNNIYLIRQEIKAFEESDGKIELPDNIK